MILTSNGVKLVDSTGMYNVLCSFSRQINEAINIGTGIEIGAKYGSSRNIIISGLGGSAIGGDLLRSYTAGEIKVPVFVNRNYFLPEFADSDTLVIISSYSGNTEESLSAYEEAKKKGCKIIIVSSGGKLSLLASSRGDYLINVPGGYQPRCALAYSFITLLFFLQKLGHISDRTGEISALVDEMSGRMETYSGFDEEVNPALKIAARLQGKIPVIYSSNDLLDIVNLRWRCQMNENAKMLAFGNYFPEMNHNEIVGWEVNPELLRNFGVVFLNDIDDFDKIKKRQEISRDLIKPYAGLIFEVSSECRGRLARIMDLVYMGDWVSFYLAVLNKVDPAPIEKINILKTKLTE